MHNVPHVGVTPSTDYSQSNILYVQQAVTFMLKHLNQSIGLYSKNMMQSTKSQ